MAKKKTRSQMPRPHKSRPRKAARLHLNNLTCKAPYRCGSWLISSGISSGELERRTFGANRLRNRCLSRATSLEQHREIPAMRTVRVRNANAEQELKVASSS